MAATGSIRRVRSSWGDARMTRIGPEKPWLSVDERGHARLLVRSSRRHRVGRPQESVCACPARTTGPMADLGSGGMRRRIGDSAPRLGRQLRRHATAAPPACATILAIMPTSTEPIPARLPCQDAIPAEIQAEVPPHNALPPSIRAVA